MNKNALVEMITSFEFHPEIYVYPTPRVYKPIKDFSLEQPVFSREVNIYIHIPFCKNICSFCGYLKVRDNEELRERYISAIADEISLYRKILKDRVVKSLHFGGGTPSLLTEKQLEVVIQALKAVNPRILETSDEVSLEATPESVSERKFTAFKDLGINRVSLGVQSLDDNEIAFSRRENKNAISRNAIEILKKIGFKNIVIDLMIGIEGQTVDSFQRTVNEAIMIRSDTVELYALGLMPKTGIAKAKDLMDSRDIYNCYDIGRNLFLSSGYKQDCHNRYAIPDRGSFLQEDYVFQGMSLIGFGAGARTYAKNMHYRKCSAKGSPGKLICEYVDKMRHHEFAVSEGTFLSPEEKMRQYAIYNLEHLNKREFFQKFKIRFEDAFPVVYDAIGEFGLTQEGERFLALNEKGLNFRDLICYQLFSENMKRLEAAYRPEIR